MRAMRALSRLRRVALEEDQKNTGEYPETERLLGELNEFNELYLALVLPRMVWSCWCLLTKGVPSIQPKQGARRKCRSSIF